MFDLWLSLVALREWWQRVACRLRFHQWEASLYFRHCKRCLRFEYFNQARHRWERG